ncbi:MAG: glucose 1-dehydrogenase [Thermomicrobiales bacterium]
MALSTSPSDRQPGIAIRPLQVDSLHLTEIPRPQPGPGEVQIKIRHVGVCGTDRELIRAHFGAAPAGEEVLVLGHEMLGEVAAVGAGVQGFAPGELVTATVRRPDNCPACQAGQPDMCQWRQYTERGIAGLHGYMTETVVEDPRYLIPVPPALAHAGILVEPLSVVEKGLRQANLIQRRINSWNPKQAVVFGTGPIGLLGALMLLVRDIDGVVVGRRPAQSLLAAEIVEAAGGRYLAVSDDDLHKVGADLPSIDLILEASGRQGPFFPAIQMLGANGVLVLLSGMRRSSEVSVSPAAINGGLLGGNKVIVGSVNSAKEDFELGVADLARFEARWPGLAKRLITRRVPGLVEFAQILEQPAGDIKTIIEV